jgi:hypothetical protein
MAADKLTALALAQKLGNQRIGYRQMLGANGPTPSDAIIAKVRAWLDPAGGHECASGA